MKVSNDRPIRPLRSAKSGTASKSGAASFSSLISDGGTTRAAATEPARAIAAVDVLLAAQQGDGDAPNGRRGAQRATSILDRLNDIRLGLLAGVIPESGLRQLIGALRHQQEMVADPGLQSLIVEIELRARVELAKLEVEY